MDVYDNPKYYEIAFSFRDIPAEADFLEKVIARYSKIPVKTFLELGSGNSPHIGELCRRGYKYIGLELNPEMVDYAREKIRKNGLNAEIIEGDMINFSLEEKADCALVFLGSLYAKNDEELEKNLVSTANSLNSGGLYILDGVVNFYPEDVHAQSWEEKKDGIEVSVGYKAEWLDENEKLLKGTITLNVKDGDEEKKIEHSEIRKIYSANDFAARAEKTGFWEKVGEFANFDINTAPKEKGRNIIVLRRK